MKIPVRFCLSVTAGLALAGCATRTAETAGKLAAAATLRAERPESSRDHWFRRDLDEKIERGFEPAGSR